MKQMCKKAIAAMVVALALVAGGMAGNTPVYAAEAPGTITVMGSGSVSVVPDVAYVSFGVTTQDASPKVAQTKNNAQIAQVIETVKALGIAENDIKTNNFYMYPNYDYNKSADKIIGYTVSNTVSVTVRDIDKVGELLGAAADAGANVSNGVQFGLLDSTEAYNEALVLAIENAGIKANTIAKAIGKAISSPSSVSESSGNYMPVNVSARAVADAEGASSVPVQAGELTVTANVNVVYEYAR